MHIKFILGIKKVKFVEEHYDIFSFVSIINIKFALYDVTGRIIKGKFISKTESFKTPFLSLQMASSGYIIENENSHS